MAYPDMACNTLDLENARVLFLGCGISVWQDARRSQAQGPWCASVGTGRWFLTGYGATAYEAAAYVKELLCLLELVTLEEARDLLLVRQEDVRLLPQPSWKRWLRRKDAS